MTLREVAEALHDKRCDRDACAHDCPYRKWAKANDRWYPGKR